MSNSSSKKKSVSYAFRMTICRH